MTSLFAPPPLPAGRPPSGGGGGAGGVDRAALDDMGKALGGAAQASADGPAVTIPLLWLTPCPVCEGPRVSQTQGELARIRNVAVKRDELQERVRRVPN